MSGTDVPLDLASFFQARAERNAYLACAALVVYEYFLQFSNEVEFFWKQRWSLAKTLFIWSRYYSLAFNISNAVIFLQFHPSPLLCNKFFHWQNTGASLQVITTHIILELRLYAMYENSRKILALFVCLTLGEATAMGIVFGVPNTKLIGTNEPFPGNFICADADPMDGSHWVVYYWASILVIESTLLTLALRKAWEHRESRSGSSLMRELTRDSVIYFITIFWIYLANLLLWFRNRITLDELGTAFSFVISSIFANRLLIAVRSNHYRGLSDFESYMPSNIKFVKRGQGVVTTTTTERQTFNDAIELGTMNEGGNTKFNELTGV